MTRRSKLRRFLVGLAEAYVILEILAAVALAIAMVVWLLIVTF
jgi:hypothetical protein